MGQHNQRRAEIHLDLSADEVDENLRRSLVGHVLRLHSGLQVEELTREMRHRSATA